MCIRDSDQRWMADTLARAGYAVESVSTAAAAMARAQANHFDAIVLDVLLPDLNGEEVLRAIRAQGPNQRTPVLVATVVADKTLALRHDVLEVFTKPVSASALLARLARAGIVAPPGRPKG